MFVYSSSSVVVVVPRSPDGGGDDDEQVRDVGDAVHQVGRDAV